MPPRTIDSISRAALVLALVRCRFITGWRASWGSRLARNVLYKMLLFSLAASVVIPLLFAQIVDLAQYNPWNVTDYVKMFAPGADYRPIYQASAALAAGENIYAMTPNIALDKLDPGRILNGSFSNYSYSPPLAYILLPLAYLPFGQSMAALSWLTVIFGVLGMYFAAKCFPWTWVVFPAGLLVYAQSTFIHFELERGQTDTLLLFLVSLGAYLYFVRRNSVATGFVLALGALVKVTPAIFVVLFVVRKDFKAMTSFIMSSVTMILLTGVPDWIHWYTKVAPFWSQVRVGWGMDHSLNYLLSWFFPETAGIHYWAFAACFVLTLAVMGLACANPRRDRYFLVELSIISILMNIATPWSSNYKLVLFIFPYLTLFTLALLELPKRLTALCAGLYFTALFFMAPVSTIPVVRVFTVVLPGLLHGERYDNNRFFEIISTRVIESVPLDSLFVDRRAAIGAMLLLASHLAVYVTVTLRERAAAASRTTADNPRGRTHGTS